MIHNQNNVFSNGVFQVWSLAALRGREGERKRERERAKTDVT
jgi:hypothetical protein